MDVVDTIIALGATTAGDISDGCISPSLVGIGADMLLTSMRSARSSRKDSSLDCFCCKKLENGNQNGPTTYHKCISFVWFMNRLLISTRVKSFNQLWTP